MIQRKTIAIVDDDEEIVLMLCLALHQEGYDCVSANDGIQGLKLIKETNPALAILDVNLPEMSGFKIARMLKFDADFSHIPVLMLTARGSVPDQELGKKFRADAYVKKPFEMALLLRRIRALLDHGGAAQK